MIEYTSDYVGQKVREIGMILSTIQDEDEISSWISDIIIAASQDDKDKAINILDKIQNEVEWR